MPVFQRFDPSACQFPRPQAALLPALRLADLRGDAGGRTDPALLDGPGVRHFARGRYALHAAYRDAGAGPDGLLLAPAYHCRTMLDPALALAAPIAFYHLNDDLTPSIDSVRALAAASAGRARALVVPHYFGVEQPAALMQALLECCAGFGMVLIEDCSHAWQVAAKRAPGSARRVLVASPYKFFASEDGGVLWGDPAQSASSPIKPGVVEQLKAIRNALARARHSDALPAPSASDNHARGVDHRQHDDQPGPLYLRALENTGCMAVSHWVMRRTSLAPLIARRRDYHARWVTALHGVPGARSLFPQLPADCAPYMFALEIERPDPVFYRLKQAGVPIWRWDEMAESDCPLSTRYRTHLLHLPCHQSLTDAQMNWMTALVVQALREAHP